MSEELKVVIDAWSYGDPIPEEYAFCVPDERTHCAMGQNLSPAIRWSRRAGRHQILRPHLPRPGRALASGQRQQGGQAVSADLPRVDFFHWVLVDIPANVRELPKGADPTGSSRQEAVRSDGVRRARDQQLHGLVRPTSR